MQRRGNCFTHVDPFEDTERWAAHSRERRDHQVSPTSIRSRILKGQASQGPQPVTPRFTHVDPFEDTERGWWRIGQRQRLSSFTHVDPFEDTERPRSRPHRCSRRHSFTHVDPFEDTERQIRR